MMKLKLIALTSAMMISNGIAVELKDEEPRRQSTFGDLSQDDLAHNITPFLTQEEV